MIPTSQHQKPSLAHIFQLYASVLCANNISQETLINKTFYSCSFCLGMVFVFGRKKNRSSEVKSHTRLKAQPNWTPTDEKTNKTVVRKMCCWYNGMVLIHVILFYNKTDPSLII